MAARQQSYGTGVIFVLLATLGWSLSGLFVRLMPGLNGWQLNSWRGFWMATALLCYLVLLHGPDAWKRFRAVPLPALLLSAGFFSVGSTLYVTSLTLIGTATVSVIGASSPVFTGLLSPWATGERPGLAAWAAAAMAGAGVTIIAWDGLEAGNAIGILVALGMTFTFASQTLTLRRFRHVDMTPALCAGGFATFLLAGFFGFITGKELGGFNVQPREMLLLALMGPLQLSIPIVFYVKGARSVPAVTVSLIAMLDAVLNPLWPWLIVGEVPERSAFIGGSVIIAAVVLSIFGGHWFRRHSRARLGIAHDSR